MVALTLFAVSSAIFVPEFVTDGARQEAKRAIFPCRSPLTIARHSLFLGWREAADEGRTPGN